MKMTDQFDEELHMPSSATPESIAIAVMITSTYASTANDSARFREVQDVPTRRSQRSPQFLWGLWCPRVAGPAAIALGAGKERHKERIRMSCILEYSVVHSYFDVN